MISQNETSWYKSHFYWNLAGKVHSFGLYFHAEQHKAFTPVKFCLNLIKHQWILQIKLVLISFGPLCISKWKERVKDDAETEDGFITDDWLTFTSITFCMFRGPQSLQRPRDVSSFLLCSDVAGVEDTVIQKYCLCHGDRNWWPVIALLSYCRKESLHWWVVWCLWQTPDQMDTETADSGPWLSVSSSAWEQHSQSLLGFSHSYISGLMFLKEVPSVHQGRVYLIKITVKTLKYY